MENEIEVNGKRYILKSTIKQDVAKPKGNLKYCIVRTYSAGVFAGYFDTKTKGKEGTVFNARRIWYWDGAASLSQLATDGTSKPQNCKFPKEVTEVILKEIIEIILCTEKAKKSIQEVKIWEQ